MFTNDAAKISTPAMISPHVHAKGLKFRLFLFTGLFLIFYFSQPYHVFRTGGSEDYHVTADPDIQIAAMQKGYAGRQICLTILGAVGAAALFRRKGDKLSVRGLHGGLIAFFPAWACLTVFWADDPVLTAKRLGVFILLGLGALAAAKYFTLREIAEFIFVSGAMAAASGLIAAIMTGTFHPFAREYRFGGLMHPNDQGICCGLFLISAIALADLSGGARKRHLYHAAALAALLFLVLTRSRTAFAGTMIAVLVYGCLRMRGKMLIASAMLAIIVLCVSYLLFGDDLFSGMQSAFLLGRTDHSIGTLNSRLPLWEECAAYFGRRPLLGYGYNAFWTARRYADIGTDLGWGMGSAHNGYMDLALGTGLVGAGAFVMVVLLAIARSGALSIKKSKARNSSGHAFVCTALIFISLVNLFESVVLLPNLATFALYLLLAKTGLAEGEGRAADGKHIGIRPSSTVNDAACR